MIHHFIIKANQKFSYKKTNKFFLMKKKNGFSLPLDIYQLISFCLLAINILFPVLVYESMIPASIKVKIIY